MIRASLVCDVCGRASATVSFTRKGTIPLRRHLRLRNPRWRRTEAGMDLCRDCR